MCPLISVAADLNDVALIQGIICMYACTVMPSYNKYAIHLNQHSKINHNTYLTVWLFHAKTDNGMTEKVSETGFRCKITRLGNNTIGTVTAMSFCFSEVHIYVGIDNHSVLQYTF